MEFDGCDEASYKSTLLSQQYKCAPLRHRHHSRNMLTIVVKQPGSNVRWAQMNLGCNHQQNSQEHGLRGKGSHRLPCSLSLTCSNSRQQKTHPLMPAKTQTTVRTSLKLQVPERVCHGQDAWNYLGSVMDASHDRAYHYKHPPPMLSTLPIPRLCNINLYPCAHPGAGLWVSCGH